eukprot:11250816-Ditylum_brightwellii.AAC.1
MYNKNVSNEHLPMSMIVYTGRLASSSCFYEGFVVSDESGLALEDLLAKGVIQLNLANKVGNK